MEPEWEPEPERCSDSSLESQSHRRIVKPTKDNVLGCQHLPILVVRKRKRPAFSVKPKMKHVKSKSKKKHVKSKSKMEPELELSSDSSFESQSHLSISKPRMDNVIGYRHLLILGERKKPAFNVKPKKKPVKSKSKKKHGKSKSKKKHISRPKTQDSDTEDDPWHDTDESVALQLGYTDDSPIMVEDYKYFNKVPIRKPFFLDEPDARAYIRNTLDMSYAWILQSLDPLSKDSTTL